ncbi:uncharacterized protein LOC131841819 [Achroia grisella]|uniref:uncharacterized protein LOC131841819 n=1 Tax=Achroia grisella TaxID=688607 RepID=UPI0027D1FCA7|nr:uncharacterized protein LOC131841819 [Achroia grisella]
MMVVILLFIVYVCTGITARPYDISTDKRQLLTYEDVPKEANRPKTQDNLLLPKVFGLNDVITVFLNIHNSKSLNISLITDDELNSGASPPCTLVLKEDMISIFQNDYNMTMNPLEGNTLKNGSEFIVGFQRIIDKSSQEESGLKIQDLHKNTIHEMELNENNNKLKYIQISGDDIKVTKLIFEYV